MAFSLYKFLTGKDSPEDPKGGAQDWWKALGLGARFIIIGSAALLVVLGAMNVWNFLFPKPSQNINKPRALVIGKAEAGAIDQRSTQILIEEKKWELEVGGGGFTYDNKLGVAGWAKIKRKW